MLLYSKALRTVSLTPHSTISGFQYKWCPLKVCLHLYAMYSDLYTGRCVCCLNDPLSLTFAHLHCFPLKETTFMASQLSNSILMISKYTSNVITVYIYIVFFCNYVTSAMVSRDLYGIIADYKLHWHRLSRFVRTSFNYRMRLCLDWLHVNHK